MKTILPTLVNLVLLTTATTAAVDAQEKNWSLRPCDEAGVEAQRRADFEAAVRSAPPDTPLYTPNPYPKATHEVFENFVSFHFNAFGDVPFDNLRPEEQRLVKALEENRVRYDVTKVENWTPLRCGSPKARTTWALLRLFDVDSGDELARATLDEVGHVARLRHRPIDRPLTPIPALDLAEARLREVAPRAKDSQLVSTWGTLKCDELVPCVAMRRGTRVLLLDNRTGRLFEFDDSAPRRSFQRDVAKLSGDQRASYLSGLAAENRALVSLGGDAFVEAALIGNASEIQQR